MYEDFAAVYDRLMRDVDYGAWADFYRGLLSNCGVAEGAAVCECACGTGGLTIPLSFHYKMTGVDISGEMLSIAMKKARDRGRQIGFVRQDMTALLLHRPQDAVLCTCDGLNYLTTGRQLGLFARGARRALKLGGVLALDVSTEYKLRHVLGDRLLAETEDDAAYIWQNQWDERERKVRMHLDIFAKTGEGTYARIEENQTQKAYSPEELKACFEENGFCDIAFYGDRRMALSGTAERMHMTARRKE